MKIRNANTVALELEATGQIVEPGEEIEVDDELGASLCEQPRNWVPVGPQGPPAEERPKPRNRAGTATPEGENEENV